MSQLARDMGSAPRLEDLLREHGWFITFVYWSVRVFDVPPFAALPQRDTNNEIIALEQLSQRFIA